MALALVAALAACSDDDSGVADDAGVDGGDVPHADSPYEAVNVFVTTS